MTSAQLLQALQDAIELELLAAENYKVLRDTLPAGDTSRNAAYRNWMYLGGEVTKAFTAWHQQLTLETRDPRKP